MNKHVVEHYGAEEQLIKTTEEAAELIKACNKYRTVIFKKGYIPSDKYTPEVVRDNLVEEMAHVTNCIISLEHLLHIKPSEIDEIIKKSDRTSVNRLADKILDDHDKDLYDTPDEGTDYTRVDDPDISVAPEGYDEITSWKKLYTIKDYETARTFIETYHDVLLRSTYGFDNDTTDGFDFKDVDGFDDIKYIYMKNKIAEIDEEDRDALDNIVILVINFRRLKDYLDTIRPEDKSEDDDFLWLSEYEDLLDDDSDDEEDDSDEDQDEDSDEDDDNYYYDDSKVDDVDYLLAQVYIRKTLESLGEDKESHPVLIVMIADTIREYMNHRKDS